MAEPGSSADSFLMIAMAGKVKTPTIFLLIAGLIMVVTLWTSKKARSVTKTELDLGRQGEGSKRFGSNFLSRSIVRASRSTAKTVDNMMPGPIKRIIQSRFDTSSVAESIQKGDKPSFDLLRASVNLVVASILISFATSLKLPLSTTYVTFMVAMGTSLADGAWGRESAVYRISCVITVIGGWFLTAFSAFMSAFFMALIISYTGIYGITILVLIAAFMVFRTHIIHKKRAVLKEEEAKMVMDDEVDDLIEIKITDKCASTVIDTFRDVKELYKETFYGLAKEDIKRLKNVNKKVKKLNKNVKILKDSLPHIISKLKEDSIDTGHYYVQVLDYLREIAHSVTFITKPCYDHVDNNHKGLISVQEEELFEINDKLSAFIEQMATL